MNAFESSPITKIAKELQDI